MDKKGEKTFKIGVIVWKSTFESDKLNHVFVVKFLVEPSKFYRECCSL